MPEDGVSSSERLGFVLDEDMQVIEMNPVPFAGSKKHDPDSALLSSGDGMILLDIPDQPRKTKAKLTSKAKVNKLVQRGDLFAQIEGAQSTDIKHTCQTAHDRNKLPLVDFYAQETVFTDTDFPTDDALFWADMFIENYGQVAGLEDRITFVRLGSRFPDNLLWGTDGITPLDVRQGSVGNCWFMAAASALAEKPQRLEKI